MNRRQAVLGFPGRDVHMVFTTWIQTRKSALASSGLLPCSCRVGWRALESEITDYDRMRLEIVKNDH